MKTPPEPSPDLRGVLIALVVILSTAMFGVMALSGEPSVEVAAAAPPQPQPPAVSLPMQQTLLRMADPAAAAETPRLATDEANLCDYGRVTLLSGRLPTSLVDEARRSLQRASDRLVGSERPFDRARGFFMRLDAAQRRAAEEYVAQRPGCAENEACRSASRVRGSAGDAWTIELARLAASSNDPQAYALAYQACRSHASELTPPTCATLTAARWAQLDPDNALPLLYMAAEAEARRDGAVRDEAVLRLTRAKHASAPWRSWIELTNTPNFSDQPRSQQAAMLDELLALQLAAPVPPYQVLVQYCSPGRMADLGQRQTCNDLAEFLTRRDGSLLAHRTGTAIAGRVGWGGERIESLREEGKLAQSVSAGLGQQRYSCDERDQLAHWLRDVALHGELGAAQRRIKASEAENSAERDGDEEPAPPAAPLRKAFTAAGPVSASR
jgi:hypothetical protein